MGWTTKDSGKRQEFPTGSLRDTSEGKPRYDLISLRGLTRLAELMARGAEKYGDRNWEKGQPVSRFYQSAFRHLMQWAMGDTSEDHLAAVVFNVFAIIEMQERVMDGELPEGLNDMLYTRRNISVVRNKITEILADQYEASLTQSGVGKAMTSDAIYSTIRLDVPVDRATVGVALVGMVEEGIVAKVGEGYSWL